MNSSDYNNKTTCDGGLNYHTPITFSAAGGVTCPLCALQREIHKIQETLLRRESLLRREFDAGYDAGYDDGYDAAYEDTVKKG